MMPSHLILVLLLIAQSSLYSQEIRSIEKVTELDQTASQVLLLVAGINITLEKSVDVYRVTYSATGSDGADDTASGLFILPQDIQGTLPILVYQHGTTDGRDDVPSNLGGGYQLAAIFGGLNMAVVAPDYLGMGTSRGFHPYIHAQTEATAAMEMVRALRSYMADNNIEWNGQLFTSGYSQGGHGAMAFHKYVQEEVPDYDITASLPMSGPYSISGVMRDVAFSEEVYTRPSFLVYTMLGMQELYPEVIGEVTDYFKAPYVPAIEAFANTGNNLGNMNESLISTLIAETGQSVPRRMFQDSVITLLTENEDHPFNQLLRENDLYNWVPEAPVLMPYCEADDQVPYINSTIADSTMNVLGATDVSAVDVSGGLPRDHGDCIAPALNTGIPWLLSYVDRTTAAEEVLEQGHITIYPNPASDRVHITSASAIQQVSIYSLSGALLAQQDVDQRSTSADISALHEGMYIMHIVTEEGRISQQISKRR